MSIGFKVNPYDPCVASRIVHKKQHTVPWHVNDFKSYHIDPKVNDEFLGWLERKSANDDIREIKVVKGKTHHYLAIVLDYGIPGTLKRDMTAYVKAMIQDFPEKFKGRSVFPLNDKLFKGDKESKKCNPEKDKVFHIFVKKDVFFYAREEGKVPNLVLHFYQPEAGHLLREIGQKYAGS